MLQSRTLPLQYSVGDLLVFGGVGVLVYYLACLPCGVNCDARCFFFHLSVDDQVYVGSVV